MSTSPKKQRTPSRSSLSTDQLSRLNALRHGQPVAKSARAKREMKFDALKALSPLGAYLDDVELNMVARSCSIVRFEPGRNLPESPFYLLLDGVVAVLSGGGDELCTRRQGTFFTRHAGQGNAKDAHKHFSPRETTIVGREPGRVLLVTSGVRLTDAYESWSSETREGYDAIVSTNLATLLSSVGFIQQANIPSTKLRRLGELCSYLALPEGSTVFKQGDAADCFYIVLKGAAEVHIDEHALTGTRRVSIGLTPSFLRTKTPGRQRSADEQSKISKGYGEVFGVAAFVFDSDKREVQPARPTRCAAMARAHHHMRRFPLFRGERFVAGGRRDVVSKQWCAVSAVKRVLRES